MRTALPWCVRRTRPLDRWQPCARPPIYAPSSPSLSPADNRLTNGAVNPPIHGWALRILRRRLRLDRAELRQAYNRLGAWTRFWLDHRRAPGSELAHYHHGNDSGWDNATLFDAHRVVESADLVAFLIVQLADLAGDLVVSHSDSPSASALT
jgi:hypothetical protein